MIFPDTSLHAMTLLFLLIVGALTVALVWLFSALETSPALTRLRSVMMSRDDSRGSSSIKR